ncbi:MAG: radical SAM protein [Candidatus Goldbacteria bacterium]|nr:radical SAM protein [Candidatus Goldiibacteriota bacterium]
MDYKYIYGPVPSWRLGSSLGIDPLSQKEKICTFDCAYCQIGKTKFFTEKRDVFVETKDIIEEIKKLPKVHIDYITFSGRGEPTLASNLGEMIRAVKEIRKEKTAVITNSSLLNLYEVQSDIAAADFVVAKLDAVSDDVYKKLNNAVKGPDIKTIIQSLKAFRKKYKGRLALQIMFIKDNKDSALEIAKIAKKIGADEIQINTPLRPCAVKPLSREEIEDICRVFKGMNTINVYDSHKTDVKPVSGSDTMIRRGKVL